MSSHAPNDPLIGSTVSQFEILAKLGGGGMGVVYKARDLKLGRLVALKFLPPQWSHDESAKQRFIREAQAASATQHKSICTIHNIEEAPDGRLFIVMAYYEGETLKQRLDRGPLPLGDAVQIGLEVAEGLAKAHAQGVVHRDIKPGNIIVTDDGAKIVDFGLAKFADALQLTVPGTTIGTVAYMSPEQTRGEEADAQSDIWAWGIVMFAMLTGRPPFRGGYPEATFHAIKNEPLPPMRTARPEISESLEQVILPALEKDRALRYASAREPARALRLLQGMTLPLDLRTQSVRVPPQAAGRPLARLGSRMRSPWVGAVAAVFAVVALAIGGWQWWTERSVQRIAVVIVPVGNHTGIADLDRYRMALTETFIDELSESPNIRVIPYLRLLEAIRPIILRGGDVSSSEAVQAITASTGAPFLIVPELLYRDRDSTWLMRFEVRNGSTGIAVATYETTPVTSSLSQDTAFRLTVSAAERAQSHFREHGPGRAVTPRLEIRRIRDREAARLFEVGQNAYEAMEYQSAADAFAGAAAIDDQHALTHAWLSRSLLLLGRRGEATTAARRAMTRVDSADRGAAAAFVRAVLAETVGDAVESEAAYRRLVDVTPDQPMAGVELADYLKRRQDQNRQAVEAYHAILGADTAYLRVHVDLCQLYTRLDEYVLADKEGALARDRAHAMGNGSLEVQALFCLAEAQRKSSRDIAGARRLAAEARRIVNGLNQPYNLARAVFYQASMEFSAGELTAAADLFEEAAERLTQAGNRTMAATSLMNFGLTRHFSGRPTEALSIYARSDQAFRDIGDERRAAEMEVNLSGLQVSYGIDTAQAKRRLRNARTNLERMGHVDFQLGAMQIDAEVERFDGRLALARQLLRAALATARDKNNAVRITSLTVALAETDLEAGDYAEALTLTGTADLHSPELSIVRGAVLTELGDVDGAEAALTRAGAELSPASDHTVLAALALARGRLAVERAGWQAAKEHFTSAIAMWSDPLVPAPVSEAHCGLGEAEAALGKFSSARRAFAEGLHTAQQISRYHLLARCRVDRARTEVLTGNFASALSALRDVPDDDDVRSLGLSLRVSVEYWRARALTGVGDPSAPQHAEAALQRLDTLLQSVPAEYHDRFSARPSVREMKAVR